MSTERSQKITSDHLRRDALKWVALSRQFFLFF